MTAHVACIGDMVTKGSKFNTENSKSVLFRSSDFF